LGEGDWKIGATAVTSTAAELNYNDITTLGTMEASKVLTADGSNIATLGGTVNLSGTFQVGGVAVTSTAAELNLVDNQPASATFDTLTGGSGTLLVESTVKDAAGTAMANVVGLRVYLATAATGLGYGAPTSVTETKGQVAGAAGALEEYLCETNATGELDVTFNVGAGTYYVVIVMPNGSLQISNSTVVS
jgi:hypothetical protein